MSNYRQIHTRAWADTWFSSLEPELKLLFIYLFSNERASACGLYELPLRIISFETGLPGAQVQAALQLFSEAGKVQYDPETGVVWVRNMLEYQSSSSPKLRARIRADIRAVPDCELKRQAMQTIAIAMSPRVSYEQTASEEPLAGIPESSQQAPLPEHEPQENDTSEAEIGYDHHNDTSLSVSVRVHDPSSVSVSLSGEGVQGEGENVQVLTQDAADPHILAAYQANIGAITPLVAGALLAAEREHGAEWVNAAIAQAVRSEVRNLRYVEAILARWKQTGSMTTGPRPRGKSGKGQTAEDVHDMLEDWLKEYEP
jgi:DnaD/phage-associated family protein